MRSTSNIKELQRPPAARRGHHRSACDTPSQHRRPHRTLNRSTHKKLAGASVGSFCIAASTKAPTSVVLAALSVGDERHIAATAAVEECCIVAPAPADEWRVAAPTRGAWAAACGARPWAMVEIAVGGESCMTRRDRWRWRREDKAAMEIAVERVALAGDKKIRLPANGPHQDACRLKRAVDARENHPV